MVEEMVKHAMFDWAPWSMRKHQHIWIKAAVSLLLLGLVFRLFVSLSVVVAPPVDGTLHVEETSPAQTPVATPAVAVEDVEGRPSEKGTCDLFSGQWIPNPTGPVYNNESCRFIQEHQNCMKNGRPDAKYLYWRWKS